MIKKWQKIALVIAVLLIMAGIALVMWRFSQPLFSIIEDPVKARAWVERRGIWARVLFVIAMALQVIIAVIPGGPLQVGAGYAFGTVEGFLLSMFAILLGSMSVFLLVKRYGRRVMRLFFSDEKIDNIELLHDPQRLNTITFILFLIPGTPKDLLTYAIGLTPMSLKTWVMICIFSRMPSVAVSIISGDAIQKKSYADAATWFFILAVLSILGYWMYMRWNAYKKRQRLTDQEKEEVDASSVKENFIKNLRKKDDEKTKQKYKTDDVTKKRKKDP